MLKATCTFLQFTNIKFTTKQFLTAVLLTNLIIQLIIGLSNKSEQTETRQKSAFDELQNFSQAETLYSVENDTSINNRV